MSRSLLRVFVTGTDTGVGKTQAACALLSLLSDRGLKPAPMKPYESGCEDLQQPADALALKAAAASRDALAKICPHRFAEPLAPGVAAQRRGRFPSFEKTQKAFSSFAGRALVVEGAGGLFVPIDAKRTVIDLIQVFELPVLLVARAGLGTLNHVALSLEALHVRQLTVSAVVLSSGSKVSDLATSTNADYLRSRFDVPVLGPVPFVKNAARRHRAFRAVLEPWVNAELAKGEMKSGDIT